MLQKAIDGTLDEPVATAKSGAVPGYEKQDKDSHEEVKKSKPKKLPSSNKVTVKHTSFNEKA